MPHDNEIVPNDCTRRVGKGLGWNDTELLALAHAAHIACTDPRVGSQMGVAELGRKIRSAFVKDRLRPEQACTTSKDGGLFDQRRWDGRSADACHKQWIKLRKECTRFKSIRDRIVSLELTGNPTNEELDRAASLEYSESCNSKSALYDCIRNPKYHIKKPFVHLKQYQYLNDHTQLLQGSLIPDKRNDAYDLKKDKRMIRPIGTKTAKKAKVSKVSGEDNLVSSTASIASTMAKLESEYAENRIRKQKIEDRKVSLEEVKFNWEMTKEVSSWLFGPESDASTEQKLQMRQMLREKFFTVMKDGKGITGMVSAIDVAPNSATVEKGESASVRNDEIEILPSIEEKVIAETLHEMDGSSSNGHRGKAGSPNTDEDQHEPYPTS